MFDLTCVVRLCVRVFESPRAWEGGWGDGR
jgi:hypothetical protein